VERKEISSINQDFVRNGSKGVRHQKKEMMNYKEATNFVSVNHVDSDDRANRVHAGGDCKLKGKSLLGEKGPCNGWLFIRPPEGWRGLKKKREKRDTQIKVRRHARNEISKVSKPGKGILLRGPQCRGERKDLLRK